MTSVLENEYFQLVNNANSFPLAIKNCAYKRTGALDSDTGSQLTVMAFRLQQLHNTLPIMEIQSQDRSNGRLLRNSFLCSSGRLWASGFILEQGMQRRHHRSSDEE